MSLDLPPLELVAPEVPIVDIRSDSSASALKPFLAIDLIESDSSEDMSTTTSRVFRHVLGPYWIRTPIIPR